MPLADGKRRRTQPNFANVKLLCLLGSVVVGSLVAPIALADQITVQAKSFIAKVDLTDPSQFDTASACGERFNAFAVNCTLWGGEDPQDGGVDSGNFRLFSQLNVQATCSGNKVASWSIGGLATSFGKEAFFQTSGNVSKPLQAVPSMSGAVPVNSVDFSYRVRGQPIDRVNQALAAARPRTCTYIWHEVRGSLKCAGGAPTVVASINGSGFPSHRLWIGGDLQKDLPQGSFKLLWQCDPLDPTSVK